MHIPSTASASTFMDAKDGPTATEAIVGAAIDHLQHAHNSLVGLLH